MLHADRVRLFQLALLRDGCVQCRSEHYKDLEPDKWVTVLGWGDAAEAKRMIDETIARAGKAQ
jgi:inorganic pyrophosphatase